MFHLRVLLPATVILVFVVRFLKTEENTTEIELIELTLEKAVSRLNIASKLIDHARVELQIDLKKKYRKNHCVEKTEDNCKCGSNAIDPKPMDCSDVYKNNNREDGVYEIWPRNRISNGSLRVYCEMKDGEGWTIIQRRGNFGNSPSYFNEDWNSYKIGFGDLEKEFWIGNDNIFALTNQKTYQIKVDLWDWKDNFKYAIYDAFWIDDESEGYKLHIGEYSGTAGDSFLRGRGVFKFSTKDKDNDLRDDFHCAEYVSGAWWFSTCLASNLNGVYRENIVSAWNGMCWYSFGDSELYALNNTVIKIRPADF